MAQRKGSLSPLDRLKRVESEARPASEKAGLELPKTPVAEGIEQEHAQKHAQQAVQEYVHDIAPIVVYDDVHAQVQDHAVGLVQDQVHVHEQGQVPVHEGGLDQEDDVPVPVPKKNPAMVRLHCFISKPQMDLINRLASRQGVDKADIVRHMIEFYRAKGPLMRQSETPARGTRHRDK